ncbi:MAG: hypothetical protein WB773_12730 [Isosphaeraceae bacterium]
MSAAASPTPGIPLPDATVSLPDDPVMLQQMIRELLDVLRQTRHEIAQLQHRLDLLLRRLYGPRTERFDPKQPLLIPDAFDAPAVPASQDAPPATDSAPRGPRWHQEETARPRSQGIAQESPSCPGRPRSDRSRAPLSRVR